MDDGEHPTDGMPFMTLSYANGPEWGRKNLTGVNTTTDTYRFPAYVEMPWETHGGEDVSIYAIGPMSHMFHTTHEQHYIAHVMMYAACMGEYSSDIKCDRHVRELSPAGDGPSDHCGAGRVVRHLFIALCVILQLLLL